jgi:hypothetical protein
MGGGAVPNSRTTQSKQAYLFNCQKFLRGKYINYAYEQKARKGVLRFFTSGNILHFSNFHIINKGGVMKHKSIFNAVSVAVVMVALIMEFGVSAQTNSAVSKVDWRFMGEWVDIETGGSSKRFSFLVEEGIGRMYVDSSFAVDFEFTVANGRIKFLNASRSDLHWDNITGIGSYVSVGDIKMDDLDFSFSDGGHTLILGKERFRNEFDMSDD